MTRGQLVAEPPPLGQFAAKVTLRGLTVRQPYASAIALADPAQLGDQAKGIENRSWPPWPQVVGTYIVIHAGQNQIDMNDARDVWRMLYGDGAGPDSWRQWVARLVAEAGKILCATRVAGSSKDLPTNPKQRRWKIAGLFGWQLEDVRALPKPIQFRGMQGLWMVQNELEREIRDQVGLK